MITIRCYDSVLSDLDLLYHCRLGSLELMLRWRSAHRKLVRDSSWHPHWWRGGERSQDEFEEEAESGDNLGQPMAHSGAEAGPL